MGTLLNLPVARREARSSGEQADVKTDDAGKVVLFTGVRYSRGGQTKSARSDAGQQHAKESGTDAKKPLALAGTREPAG